VELKLTKILSSLTLLAAWAYSLGWIRSFYYFGAFGVGLESTELSVQDYLFASWYTVENVLFFVLLLWVAVIAQRKWVYAIAAVYLPIPYVIDLSYSYLSSPIWGGLVRWFVNVPHSVLKFLPFVLLFVVFGVGKNTRERFKEYSWPHGNFAFVVLSIVVVAWSVSAAKHFGTSDANRILRDPGKYFLRVNPRVSESAPSLKALEYRQSLYLLYYSQHRCILFDTTGFAFGQRDAHVTLFYVPTEKIDMVEGLRAVQLDPGHLAW
jgi:hypothetical protein